MSSAGDVRVLPKELSVFLRRLARLTRFGIPQPRAIEMASQGLDNRRLREVIGRVRKSVEGGNSLSEAMSHESSLFPLHYAAALAEEEQRGNLPSALKSLAEDLDESVRAGLVIRRLSLKAILAVVAMAGVVLAGVALIVPLAFEPAQGFMEIFEGWDTTLPATGFVFFWRLGKFMTDNGLTILLILCGAAVLVIGCVLIARSKPAGRLVLDRLKLVLPLYKQPVRSANLSIFCGVLGSGLRRGLSAGEALAAARKEVRSEVLKEEIGRFAGEVDARASLSEAMRKSRWFPRSLVRAVAAGESRGNVGSVLLDMADLYREESEYGTRRLSRWAAGCVGCIIAVLSLFCVMTLLSTIFTAIFPFRHG